MGSHREFTKWGKIALIIAMNPQQKIILRGHGVAHDSQFGDSGKKGGDPFCDLTHGSCAHICMSCVSSVKLCVFETHAIGFTISDIYYIQNIRHWPCFIKRNVQANVKTNRKFFIILSFGQLE